MNMIFEDVGTQSLALNRSIDLFDLGVRRIFPLKFVNQRHILNFYKIPHIFV